MPTMSATSALAQAFERQHHDLAQAERQRLHRGLQALAPLLLRQRVLRIRLPVAATGASSSSGVGAAPLPVIDVADRAVVGDAEHERALRALAAKPRQRLPHGEPDVLDEILLPRRIALVAGGQPPQRAVVLVQQPDAAVVAALGPRPACSRRRLSAAPTRDPVAARPPTMPRRPRRA